MPFSGEAREINNRFSVLFAKRWNPHPQTMGGEVTCCSEFARRCVDAMTAEQS